MEPTRIQTSPARGVVDRLLNATNDHDLDALVGCFAQGYVNETPAHPARGFTGADQVRRNWTQIFTAVPDLAAKVTDWTETDDRSWTEWEMSGHRADGTPHLMRGVIIFAVVDDRISSARFYLEPVENLSGNVDTAVAARMAARP
jgi:ketosteroid isomerase-like protein